MRPSPASILMPMNSTLVVTAAIAAGFALVHVLGVRLVFLRSVPRSVWLSAAGGVSVAYVFIHVLPELAERQEGFSAAQDTQSLLQGVERHVYLLALAGLAAFYGLDRLARTSARRNEKAAGIRQASTRVFWIHLGAYAIYNMLIGYLLLHREEQDARGLAIYAFAMGLHFVVNDQGLREQHGETYDRAGRWLLAAAPVVGWVAGLAVSVSPLAVSALFAVLAGSVVLNVLKEELPEDRESRFAAFAAGTAAYAALLLATQ
jgi:zinc transporter ZupT